MAGRKRGELAGAGAGADLARRLRAERDARGLTLRQLAAKSGYSPATLSGAENGRRVPTWEVTAAFVQSCGGDAAQWRQLWELAGESAPETVAAFERVDPAEPAVAPEPPPPDHGRSRYQRRGWLAGAALAGAAALSVIAVLGWAATRRTDPAAPSAGRQSESTAASYARDGTDPYDDGCKADEKELDWQVVSLKSGATFGSIELMYSPACQAAWGYLRGPNSAAWTTHIIAHRIPGDATAPSEFNGNAAYGSWGNVLSTRSGCVSIEAYVVDAQGQGPHATTACMQPVSGPGGNP